MSLKTAFSWRGIAALAFLCTVAARPALGQEPTRPQQQPRQEKAHVVRKGDTLWDLARFYFNNPFRWPVIFEANRNIVANPHWIYPAEKLLIPGERPIRLLGTPVPAPTPADSPLVAPPVAQEQPTVVTAERDVLSLVQPNEWMGAPWIADSASLNINATVLKSADPRNQNDKLAQTFHPRDELFISTIGGNVKAGDRLLVIRLTRNFRGLGWLVEPQGILLVDSIAPSTARAMIVSQFSDLKIGDLAVPLPSVPALPAGQMTAVTGGPTGDIIDFLVPQPLVGTAEHVFVSLNTTQGISIGDELVAYLPEIKPTEKRPEVLPEQPVALLRVIRVNERAATARVVRLYNAALEKGLPVRVARKAP